jgi:hypothetical protein
MRGQNLTSARLKMNRLLWLIAFCISLTCTHAAVLRLSSVEPVLVTAPAGWTATQFKPAARDFPFESFRIAPAGDVNAVCLVSIVGKNDERFDDKELLQKAVKLNSRPFVKTEKELESVDLHELKIHEGAGYYADFVDPDLVEKPVKKGSYKVATPVMVNLGKKYLIKLTILSDKVDGPEYKELIKVVETLRVMHLI